jgi:antitoxin component YwqK of YwqJK toxin-antitoxin module
MRILFTCFCSLISFLAQAQSREEFFDFRFHPTKTSPFYYAVTEKKDSAWLQRAYYVSTSRMGRECFYKDENCTTFHGKYRFFDVEGFLKETGTYTNGKKEGLWLGYNNKGYIIDSGVYVNDHLKGIRLKWYSDGMQSDSLNFDGKGNGVQISWYNDGNPASAGYWTQDTLKKGRWKYFFRDGTLKATEDYVDGKIAVCNCYTEKGEPIDTALCREKEAVPAGGTNGWIRFLQKSLTQIVINLATKGVKPGRYTVLVKFIVLEDGTVSDLTPLTKLGQGIEEEVVKVLKSAPKWEPGRMFGRPVRSYHTQPVTFVIQER